MRWHSLPDAARRLGWLRRTTLEAIRSGRLRARLVAGQWWISELELHRQGVRLPKASGARSAKGSPTAA